MIIGAFSFEGTLGGPYSVILAQKQDQLRDNARLLWVLPSVVLKSSTM